ncbi:IPExxxVDY family protein [Aestuariivivens sp. NBU2969]|uniref:IPExxxVDY family protein n=1 Tax=Aestuariivivens sp. NBU2969 TaxID=2873267 RepID=UPI001CBA9D85|nr:IPExxxVDY family protein [Aestuariivivens sp. NBU2969]
MAVRKLVLDDFFDEEQYTLIGIHCTLEDYRLAYLLNKYLEINLLRKPEDLDFDKGKSVYSIFEWEDSKHLKTWSLVSNICKREEQNKTTYASLFETQEPIIKTYNLIPEYKQVNFFLKIENEYNDSKEKYIVKQILSIPQIVTAYSIDTSQLKSKANLIFS